jgi:drug/metabolite transporter (DMT)-like permease
MILVGGGLMAVGALLPWETATVNGASLESVKGTSEGAGPIVLACGGVIALLAFLLLNGTVKRKAGIATLIVSLVAFVFAAGNWTAISDDIDKAKNAGANGVLNVDANLGIGLIMAIAGCVLAAIASILLLRQKDVAAAP